MTAQYDGRYSARCEQVCQAGECSWPRTVNGCGGCCGCLGGCVEGYEEQMTEHSPDPPPDLPPPIVTVHLPGDPP